MQQEFNINDEIYFIEDSYDWRDKPLRLTKGTIVNIWTWSFKNDKYSGISDITYDIERWNNAIEKLEKFSAKQDKVYKSKQDFINWVMCGMGVKIYEERT